MTRQQLRQHVRQLRNALDQTQQENAADHLLAQVKQLKAFNSAHSIALYLAADGEIGTQAIIEHCWETDKKVYLPVLDPNLHNQLLFVHYHCDTAMTHNKYGIAEPATPYQSVISASELDLVLLPLVAFDDTGARMGMGGGYYDRSFAFINEDNTGHAPQLYGLAHNLQQVSQLQIESWDIPLEGIVTDQQVISGSL
jgi:5-formyltetrahydrofolate cyclo-ligase